MIIFSSFMDPTLDPDLLVHWIDHYTFYGFDRYHVLLHVNVENDVTAQARHTLEKAGFTTDQVVGTYRNGDLQREQMTRFKASLNPDDTLVLADSDEFHIVGFNYREQALKCDYIIGELIDRWGDRTVRAKPDIPLDVQYPYSGDIYDTLRETYNLTDGNWIWSRQKTKVLAHKARYFVELAGNHFILDREHSKNIIENQEVDHFTWRDGIIQRMVSRTYNPIWWTFMFLKHFGYDRESVEFQTALEYHKKQQAEKGLAVIYG